MTDGSVDAASDPPPAEARERIDRALDAGRQVALFGPCRVEYVGRASSSLAAGVRHVLLKPDGTVLVHGAAGREPAAWQPPGGSHEAAVRDGGLRVRTRRDGAELAVDFDRVSHLVAFEATDGREVEVRGTEADLRERVLDAPDLVEPGFRPLATERQTAAGAVDVYGEDADGNAVVVELKRRRVGPDAVGQLERYVTAVRRDSHADAAVRGVLVAPSVTPRARRLLAEQGLEFVSLAPGD